MPPKKTEDTPKSVLSTIQELKKKYPQNTNTTKTPTGILPLDYVLRGGIVAPTFVQLAGESGSGKALIKGTGILTPTGIVKIEDLKVGDLVLDKDGSSVKVLGHYPQGKKELVKVSFRDGTYEICCKEHLWYTNTALDRHKNSRKNKFYPVDTNTMMQAIFYTCKNKKECNYAIPYNQPLQFREQPITLHPYVLGCLLGDGYLNDSSITISNTDSDLLKKFEDLLPKEYKLSNKVFHNHYKISRVNQDKHKENTIPSFKKYIEDLGLFGCKSQTKFIPKQYLWNTIEVRKQLLYGLMDTDGSVEKKCNGNYAYWTQSLQLAKDVEFLVKSLGYRATVRPKKTICSYKGKKIDCARTYRVNITAIHGDIPVSIPVKVERVSKNLPQRKVKHITSIEPYGVDEAYCIMVDSPTHTYVTENFTVTHNTTCALSLAKNFVKKGQNVLYLNFEQSVIQVLAEDMGLFKYPEEQFCMLAPATIAESEDIIRKLIYITPIDETPAFQHIFFDSVGAMTPDWAEEKEVMSDDNTPAVRARQLSKFFDINNAKLKRRGVCCWFINHLTNKIAMKYGEISGMVTKGGTAVQYWTDIWVYLSKGASLDQKDQANATGNKKFESSKYANIGTIWVEKGRSGGMMKKTECPVFFGKGISNVYWLYLVLKNEGYVKTNGSYLNCTLLDENGVNCQGVPKLLGYLQEHQKEVISTMKKKGLWNFFDNEDDGLPEEE